MEILVNTSFAFCCFWAGFTLASVIASICIFAFIWWLKQFEDK